MQKKNKIQANLITSRLRDLKEEIEDKDKKISEKPN